MKFSSFLCAGMLVAAAAMAGDVYDTETVGWLRVDSTAKTTIVSVPWLEVGGGNVTISKLVKTDTLALGTQILYYDGSNYFGWNLTEDANHVKSWTATAVSYKDASGANQMASADDTLRLQRGKALFIVRANGSASGDIYLYGQYSSASPAAVAIVQGSAETPAYTLIGNPSATAVSLNTSGLFTGTIGADDQILIPNAAGSIDKQCTYENGSWGWWNPALSTVTVGSVNVNKPGRDTTVSIPAGRGVWYVSKGGNPSVQF